jgi:hypothetical protein
MIDRVGEENYNNAGTLMKIIEYKNCDNVLVEFQDEHKIKKSVKYKNFKKGNIKNPYDKTVFGVGYIGEGKYNAVDNSYTYARWKSMLRRCYDPYLLNKYPTYRDCYVCDEWLCFQNFSEWYEENHYECNNEKMCLDKDILIKGNKVYSPNTCIIVPERVNTLFIKAYANRGKYPIGVCLDKKTNKFRAHCHILDKDNKKLIQLGYYNSIEEAFLAYKSFKENYIKQVADEYKDLIPKELYKAMYSYVVDIDD